MLQQAKMAELGSVLSAIMHQWMQPLNTLSLIVGNISLNLKECDASQKVDKLVKDARGQIGFMTQTMYDFRSFFKPSEEMDVFCPCVLLKRLYLMFEGMFLEDGIEVQIGNEHRCKNVRGHQSEYIQVLLNILKNARDALVDRGIEHKKIVCLIDDSLKGFVRIVIRDNAGGIEPLLLPDKIFEPFVTTKGSEGTGIGLHISKSIVENRFGGRLRAHNTGDGAEFWIDIVSIEE